MLTVKDYILLYADEKETLTEAFVLFQAPGLRLVARPSTCQNRAQRSPGWGSELRKPRGGWERAPNDGLHRSPSGDPELGFGTGLYFYVASGKTNEGIILNEKFKSFFPVCLPYGPRIKGQN